MNIETDGDGFLKDRSQWSEEVMHELAAQDGLTLNEEHIKYIMAAKAMYVENDTVPSIREFAKSFGMDRKAKPLYELFQSGVMKRLAKYGALPKPTGCV